MTNHVLRRSFIGGSDARIIMGDVTAEICGYGGPARHRSRR
jgi:hypothetical protein